MKRRPIPPLMVLLVVAPLAMVRPWCGQALASSGVQAQPGPVTTLEPELVVRTGVRVPPAAGDPAALDPREGALARIGLHGAAGPWRWHAAVALDGWMVPFVPAGVEPGWNPEVVGLRDPGGKDVRLDRLWLSYAAPGDRWSVWAGRRALHIGSQKGIMDLPLAPGLDQVGVELAWDWGTYRRTVARSGTGNRWLLVHHLELGPAVTEWGRWRLAGYELGVVSDEFFALPYTWIPFWPGYLTQHLAMDTTPGPSLNNEANFYMGLGVHGDGLFGRPVRLDAEVLVDDMPQLPWKDQLYQLGAAVCLTLNDRWRLRYVRANNFVITFQNPSLSLIDRGRLLAYPDGPDADSLAVERLLAVDQPLAADRLSPSGLSPEGVSVEWRRRGAGRVGETWEDHGYAWGKEREFLSGVVEHAVLAGISARLGAFHVRLEAGPILQVANRPGVHGMLFGLVMRVDP